METRTLPMSVLLSLRDSLESAHSMHQLEDMIHAYRQLNRQSRSSPMTLSLKQSLEALNRYLDADE